MAIFQKSLQRVHLFGIILKNAREIQKMELQEAKKIYSDVLEKSNAFSLCFYLSSLDIETETMPPEAVAYRSKQLSVINGIMYDMSTSAEYVEAVKILNENSKNIDPDLAHEAEVECERIKRIARVPKDELLAFSEMLNMAYPAYVEAKLSNDFEKFRPYLEKIVDFKRKYVEYVKTDDLSGYDVLLSEFEHGYTAADYDKFFDELREKLVPFIKKIAGKSDVPEFAKKTYPKEKQSAFCDYLRDVMCFDRKRTAVLSSEHPFTANNGCHDVRITNHYYEDNFISSIFSAIHEMGHGLYELQIDEKYEGTGCSGGASLAIHESQSRLMENMIGRSLAFWQTHFPKLKGIFADELDGVTAEDMFKYVNRVEYSLIRTEADELTYPIHVLIRYEIEKMLMSGKLSVKDVPSEWNKKYKEYLNVDVPSDKDGCLQDMHWSDGSIGYFPTYALGSAYAAQIYHAMSKDIDIDEEIKKGNIGGIAAWLKEHLHKYGASKYPKELIKLATGEDFSPNYYVDYLIDKYSKIYNV